MSWLVGGGGGGSCSEGLRKILIEGASGEKGFGGSFPRFPHGFIKKDA